ncbi:MAG: adaptor protein MecA [Hespellia sp.]|nr:adaptor protein MecA [Hespellia sp.]
MKIEKLNDNQIRCTLTHADLADRHLKLSELAYGTEKAKALFRDMMQQASFDFGFEAEDIPLMIEAIPASADSLVLIITKVEDPEELDTRFSRFTPLNDSESGVTESLEKLEGADEFLNLLDKVKEAANDAHTAETPTNKKQDIPQVRLFSFEHIDDVIRAAHLLSSLYHGENTLYKDPANGFFILALVQSDHTTNDFNKICNMLSEYGTLEKASGVTMAFLEEHCNIMIPSNAVQNLAIV